MRERLRIAVDLDEVLAPNLSCFLEFLRDRYDISLKLKDFATYAWFDTLGESVEKTVGKIRLFRKTEYFQNMMPIEGVVASMKELSKNADIFVVTARMEEFEEDTVRWLERHFDNLFLAVCFADNAYSGQGGRLTKAQIVKDLSVRILIEDDVNYALEAAGAGIVVFLVDRPWNQGELPHGVQRISSWGQILEKLNRT